MSVDDGLRPLFRKHILGFHWQSVETGGTGRGIPDSNFCHKGVEGWIEFKSTDGHAVDLRPEQIGWIEQRTRHGGIVWIAVRRRHDGGPRRGTPVDELHLFPGALAKVARLGGLRDPVVAHHAHVWHHGPTNGWNWPNVAAVLTKRPPLVPQTP